MVLKLYRRRAQRKEDWNRVLENIKNAPSLKEFKSLVKKWQPNNCTCRLCKSYIDGIGFVDIIDQA